MTDRWIIFSLCSLPFSAALSLPMLMTPVCAAPTTTLPIETHSLQALPAITTTEQTDNTDDETIGMNEEAPLPPAVPVRKTRHYNRPAALKNSDLQKLRQIKHEVSATAVPAVAVANPDNFELGGVRLGMNFTQARNAMAANLGINVANIHVSGAMPEAETCTPDTQLNGEGANGSMNVQFACNAKLPLRNELSVDHISYEPATGTIENVLNRAIKKYGPPVNLADADPAQADFVSYDWCRTPQKDPASRTGHSLYCPAKKESRLRLQGRDNSLEFQLIGLVGAARYYQEGSIPPSLNDNDDTNGNDF